MKRNIALLICIAIAFANLNLTACAFWWGEKPTLKNVEGFQGYAGKLPDINKEFEYLRPNTMSKDIIKVETDANIKDLVPAPRKEKMYIDIIKKKDRTSNYLNDLNEIINSLEAIKISIIRGETTQIFNAQVNGFIDLAYFLQKEYANKAESNYISFKRVQQLSTQAYTVANLRTEATIYSKYMTYENEGAIYRPQYINTQVQLLLDSINQTLPILREAD